MQHVTQSNLISSFNLTSCRISKNHSSCNKVEEEKNHSSKGTERRTMPEGKRKKEIKKKIGLDGRRRIKKEVVQDKKDA